MPGGTVAVMTSEHVSPKPQLEQGAFPNSSSNVTAPGAEGQGLAKRRLSAASLPPLTIPQVVSPTAKVHTSPARMFSNGNSPYDLHRNRSEVVLEGKHLFGNFVKEEIKREGLDIPEDVKNCFSPVCRNPGGHQHAAWAKAGQELREMADAFSRTKERQRVRKRAGEIGINDITFDQFEALLCELFSCGKVTRERIVVLFFFCSDLAIRALHQKAADYFERFIKWSFRYIADKVCEWVRNHGGWAVVLGNSLHSLKQFGIFMAVGMMSICAIRWLRHKF